MFWYLRTIRDGVFGAPDAVIYGPRKRCYNDACREARRFNEEWRPKLCPRVASAAIAASFKRRYRKVTSDRWRTGTTAQISRQVRDMPCDLRLRYVRSWLQSTPTIIAPRARPLETGNEQRNRGKRSDSPSLDIQPGGDADRSGGTGRCVWAISGLRTVTWTALAGLVALSVVAKGVLSLKAGMFTMPDPQHASWQFLIPAILRSLQAERVVREAHGGVSRS